MLRYGVLGGGYALLSGGRARSSTRVWRPLRDDELPPSPPTTPFVMDLPLPPVAQEVPAFSAPTCAPFVGPGTKFFKIVEEQRLVQVHPQIPPTPIWGYRDFNVPAGSFPFLPGPTFKVQHATALGQGIVVQQINALPANAVGFGVPNTTVHLHGGHQPSTSDGFPNLDFAPGESFDYCYPLLAPGSLTPPQDNTDIPATLWYHDHLLDFTGPNVYRGLAGFFLVFDELDSGDENDPNPAALRLPSGAFDVPLLFQDKRFAADGTLLFDTFDHDGFLGDKFLVNGAIQPRFHVKRRKYRFRLLNGSNARFYDLFLRKANGQGFPFTRIGTDGGLQSVPIPGVFDVFFGPAERVDIVIDFSQFAEGDEVFFVDRIEQDDGRGPDGDFDDLDLVSPGTKILKFIVEEAVPDPSQVPSVLRPFDAISAAEIAAATEKTFVFERQDGAWAINDQFVDLDQPLATSPTNGPEVWHLVNQGGGWWHPIHVHSEFMHILTRNGELPPPWERDGIAKKDDIILGPNDEVEAFLKFRDFLGPFVFHCHNLEHEDMAMMARFDVV
ncbi:MAG TPA: multicopper oxidase domain-containing protein [Planctomycetota bacterium]|nr:multicopper oxidase domain-containing protein [Planctomycetota bacterium]